MPTEGKIIKLSHCNPALIEFDNTNEKIIGNGFKIEIRKRFRLNLEI